MPYKIYFPLFDHIEAKSNEMRLTREGLVAHPRVILVDDPGSADYLIFCQNHFVRSNPAHTEFRAIKDRYKERSVMLDYDDNPHAVYDADDFRWKLYFKRSCVDRTKRRPMEYGTLPVLPTAYCVTDDMAEPPAGHNEEHRSIAVSCLFDDAIFGASYFRAGRAALLKFAKVLVRDIPSETQIGTVSECGPVGRSRIDERYKECLFDSRIVLHANPDRWEGDARTWEAVSSGALVFIDRLYAPIENPLVDGRHVIFYDLTAEGMKALKQKILYYLQNEEERRAIGMRGREFVLAHHRSIHRVDSVIRALEHTERAGRFDAPSRGPERVSSCAVSGCTRVKPDIILSIATGYRDVSQYRNFVSTLRRSGATRPVFLGISEGPECENVIRYLLENSVNYFFVPPISPPHKVVNGYRFEQYRRWINGFDFRFALMLDFRDVYFQRDPFIEVEALMSDCDLYLMSEFKLLTIGNHPNGMNHKWVADAFGKLAADSIAHKVILNCGAILGYEQAVRRLLNEYAWVSSQSSYEFVDQGTLNYLAHTGRLDHCGRMKIAPAGESLVNNCGFTEIDLLARTHPITREQEKSIAFIPRDSRGRLEPYRNPEGWILDDDGSVSCVVHQYDRFGQDVADFVARLADYECPDTVYAHGKDSAYRGQKFILSSRKEIKAGMLDKLISRIKKSPMDRKPLLLIDRHFKHGFVFAYGILHNELLFESEAFRQAFFEETTVPDKCDAFCRKWGYQAVFVDEPELFSDSPAA